MRVACRALLSNKQQIDQFAVAGCEASLLRVYCRACWDCWQPGVAFIYAMQWDPGVVKARKPRSGAWERNGAEIVTTEMVVFEWLGTAADHRLRNVIDLIR